MMSANDMPVINRVNSKLPITAILLSMKEKASLSSPSNLMKAHLEQLHVLIESLLDKGEIEEKVKLLNAKLFECEAEINASKITSMSPLFSKLKQQLTFSLVPPCRSFSEKELKEAQEILQHLMDSWLIHVHFEITTSTPMKHKVLIGLKDDELAQEISAQIKYFNYDCILCENVEEIAAFLANSSTIDAILLGSELCAGYSATEIKQQLKNIPTLFISTNEDIATRLYAVQAGGEAFITFPLEFTNLIEKLDQAVIREGESVPYRILVVEDSRTQANIVARILEQAGMIVQILADPLKANEVLIDFQPELILLDLHMPKCLGTDFAKAIRQQDVYVSVPIVYLSVEEDMSTQFAAIKNGGDDFLSKPVLPDHLIATITSRVHRYRALHAELIQDSLTGLFNHSRVLEQLDLEIARAKRNNTSLCFAMIDLDHFKAVNDSYGHPVGDRVIKGIARILKQRLRKTDSIGRYGGEEFAVILPQTSSNVVFHKLEEIRRGFATLLHRSADPCLEFTVTFSAGLAEFSSQHNTIDKLVQAADQALYLAKAQGRNQIIISNSR